MPDHPRPPRHELPTATWAASHIACEASSSAATAPATRCSENVSNVAQGALALPAQDRKDPAAAAGRSTILRVGHAGASRIAWHKLKSAPFPPPSSGSPTGYGVDDTASVLASYQFAGPQSFSEGDRIYLFGFSRGAYTVRVLAGLDPQDRADLAGAGQSRRQRAHRLQAVLQRRPARRDAQPAAGAEGAARRRQRRGRAAAGHQGRPGGAVRADPVPKREKATASPLRRRPGYGGSVIMSDVLEPCWTLPSLEEIAFDPLVFKIPESARPAAGDLDRDERRQHGDPAGVQIGSPTTSFLRLPVHRRPTPPDRQRSVRLFPGAYTSGCSAAAIREIGYPGREQSRRLGLTAYKPFPPIAALRRRSDRSASSRCMGPQRKGRPFRLRRVRMPWPSCIVAALATWMQFQFRRRPAKYQEQLAGAEDASRILHLRTPSRARFRKTPSFHESAAQRTRRGRIQPRRSPEVSPGAVPERFPMPPAMRPRWRRLRRVMLTRSSICPACCRPRRSAQLRTGGPDE